MSKNLATSEHVCEGGAKNRAEERAILSMWRPSPTLPLAGWLSHLPSHPVGVSLSEDVSRTGGTMEWTRANQLKICIDLGTLKQQKRQPKGNKGNLPWQWHLNHAVQLPSFTFQSSPQSTSLGLILGISGRLEQPSVIRHPRNNKGDNQISWWINILLRKERPVKNILIVSER